MNGGIITRAIGLPEGYDSWCLGKNGYAHKYVGGPDGPLVCERVCDPWEDPRYQQSVREGIEPNGSAAEYLTALLKSLPQGQG